MYYAICSLSMSKYTENISESPKSRAIMLAYKNLYSSIIQALWSVP